MAAIVVNISDMKISQHRGSVLTTFSLGSCLGVAAWDPALRTGGLIHCLLPLSATAPRRARRNPFMFVDTGVDALLTALFNLGAKRERLVIKAAGGANMRSDDPYNIGARNSAALEELLSRRGLHLAASEFGGTIPRTLTLFLDSGRVTVKTLGKEHEL